ncbi:MAG: ATP-binding protein [Campylobacterales bacterium]|nr:ATP-binding protein [Campylobacterales bacterium]
MSDLEFLFSQNSNIKKLSIHDRKYQLNSNRTFIHGAKKSGKTYFAFSKLCDYDKNSFLYIDLEIYNVDFLELTEFIQKNKIILLIIDNYKQEFKLPSIKNIILISNTKVELQGFEYINIKPLDFEEFISFSQKNQTITHLFNNFIKDGTLPEITTINEFKKYERWRELITLISNNPLKSDILKLLINSIGYKYSSFQLFNILKKSIKISKDFLYKYIKDYEDEEILFFVEKYNHPKSPKKIYIYDFAIQQSITNKKNFVKIFENMIFLELKKRYNEIYYLEFCDFYIQSNNIIYFVMPFVTKNQIETKIDKTFDDIKEFNIKYIKIITAGYEENFTYKQLSIEAEPFYFWALED